MKNSARDVSAGGASAGTSAGTSASASARDSAGEDTGDCIGNSTSRFGVDHAGASDPAFSIVIPAYNEEAYLGDTLETVRQCIADIDTTYGPGELIVVDNNSSDATAEIARSHNATVVFEPHNQISRARNSGAAAASGSYLLFLDADTLLSTSVLQQALDNLSRGACVGGGVTIEPDQPVSRKALWLIRYWNFASRRFGMAAGCFIYCRRDAFESVGGFNEKLYASEEVWLSRALRRHGRSTAMNFCVIEHPPIVTSMRKLEWYSQWQLLAQALVLFFPFTLFSKRFCALWYERPR